MCPLRRSLLILNILILSAAANHICDFDDVKCATQAANKLLKTMSSGIAGLVEPLDPLHEARIVLNSSDIVGLLTNITLTGMKQCRVDLLSFIPKQLTYVYELRCPHFVFTTTYAIKGNISSLRLEHEGRLLVTLRDYVITFKGQNAKSLGKEDNKTRLYVEAYRIETEAKGGVTYEDTGLNRGDKTQVQSAWQYLSENWRTTSSVLTRPTMHKFMSQYMEKLNHYLKKTPIDDIFGQEKKKLK